MKLSKQMREDFVSDNSLPIQIMDDPYFDYYVELLDPYYHSMKKYKSLLSIVGRIGEEKLHEEIKQFKNSMIHYIEQSGYYQNFCHDMQMPEPITPINKGNLYQPLYTNRKLISIDLIEANYQALKYACPELLGEWKNYGQFAKEFTDIPYIIWCKKLRQIIFGQLSPARQQSIQRYIISEIKFYLMDVWGVNPTDFINTSSDEIVFESTINIHELNGLVCIFDDNYDCAIPKVKGIRLRINTFTLLSEGTDKFKFFTKLYKDGHKEIKGVDSACVPEVIKFLEGKVINSDFDRLFIKDGRLCKFQESLF